MLETWEAGLKFLETTVGVSSIKAIEITRLLGWTAPRGAGRQVGDDMMNSIARACHAAHALIFPSRSPRDGASCPSKTPQTKLIKWQF